MLNLLNGAQIVLGVTGSIASYKAVDLASKLVQAKAQVDVVLTPAASQFINPLTFRSITHRPVTTNAFDDNSELSIQHVALSERAQAIIIAPATADFIAKLAHGLADDALSMTVLATNAPILIAPAMDAHMWENSATQANVELLKQRGFIFVGPEPGRLASGLTGLGRLSEPQKLLGHINALLGHEYGDLNGKHIVVSAGGTQEPVDPVRVLTNRSSGKMGYAIAEAARDRGAKVTLVSASNLPDPAAVDVKKVQTVAEMRNAVLNACANATVVIMAAAVSDFRPAEIASQKVKKSNDLEELELKLIKNADFFLEIPDGVLRVGFAAETEDLIANAKLKIRDKGLALIAANDVTEPGSGFNTDTNQVTLIDYTGNVEELPLMTKYEVGQNILDRVASLLEKNG